MDDAEVRYMHLQCELEQVRKELVEGCSKREAAEAEAHMQSLERNAANQRGDELEIERDALAAQVKKLTWNLENAENLFQVARRRAWEFHDRPSTCPYCMAQMPCTKDAVTGHHAVCPRDPMRKVEAELEQARKELVEVKAEMWYLEPTEEGCGGATWKMYAEHLSLECNELRKELAEASDNFDTLSQQYLERAEVAEKEIIDFNARMDALNSRWEGKLSPISPEATLRHMADWYEDYVRSFQGTTDIDSDYDCYGLIMRTHADWVEQERAQLLAQIAELWEDKEESNAVPATKTPDA